MDEVSQDTHLRTRGFFYDIDRPHVGRQLQAGLPVTRGDRERYPMRGLAPYLGRDSRQVLADYAGVGDAAFEELIATGIVSLQPTELRRS